MDIDKNNINNKCDFSNHEKTKSQNLSYCHNCEKRFCSECLKKHNSSKNISNHSCEILSVAVEKAKKTKEQIINSPLMNYNITLNSKTTENESLNSLVNKFANILNQINNINRNQFMEYKQKINEINNQKKLIKENSENINKDNLLLLKTIDNYKNLNNKVDLLRKNILDLYYSVNNILNKQKNINQKKKPSFSKESKINFTISGDRITSLKKGDKNKIDINNKIEIKLTGDKIKFNSEKKEDKRKEQNENKNNKFNVEKQNNSNKEKEKNEKVKLSGNNSNEKEESKNYLVLNFITNNKLKDDENLINKKTKRDKSNNNIESIINGNSNQNNKKQKLENFQGFLENNNLKKDIEEKNNNNMNINDSNNLLISSLNSINNNNFKNIIINNNQNIIFSNNKNKYSQSQYIYGLSLSETNELESKENNEFKTFITVVETRRNERPIIRFFNSNQIRLDNSNYYFPDFPYTSSRIININNEAISIGGRVSNDINDKGITYCFKISFINNDKNDGLGEIKFSLLKNTCHPHHSHALLYSKLFKVIMVVSGHNQRRCEIANLNDNLEIDDWAEINPLRYPMENPISFLYNDKYVYLIGGIADTLKLNEISYEFFDLSTIFNKNYGIPTWTRVILKDCEFKKYLYETKGPGIVELNNNIYIFGGYNKFSQIMACKFSFKKSEIEKIEKFDSNKFPKEKVGFSFYGQQNFIFYEDHFINISINGNFIVIPKTIFNNIS